MSLTLGPFYVQPEGWVPLIQGILFRLTSSWKGSISQRLFLCESLLNIKAQFHTISWIFFILQTTLSSILRVLMFVRKSTQFTWCKTYYFCIVRMPTLYNSMKPPTFLLSFSHSLNDSFCAKPRKSPFPLLPHTTSKEERRKKLWDLPIQSIAQATTDLLTEEVIFFCEVAAVLWAITIDISGKGISRETADRSNSAWKSKGIRLWRKKNFLSIPRNLIWVFRKLRNWGKSYGISLNSFSQKRGGESFPGKKYHCIFHVQALNCAVVDMAAFCIPDSRCKKIICAQNKKYSVCFLVLWQTPVFFSGKQCLQTKAVHCQLHSVVSHNSRKKEKNQCIATDLVDPWYTSRFSFYGA